MWTYYIVDANLLNATIYVRRTCINWNHSPHRMLCNWEIKTKWFCIQIARKRIKKKNDKPDNRPARIVSVLLLTDHSACMFTCSECYVRAAIWLLWLTITRNIVSVLTAINRRKKSRSHSNYMHSAKITIKYPLSLVPFARQLLWWSLPVFFWFRNITGRVIMDFFMLSYGSHT